MSLYAGLYNVQGNRLATPLRTASEWHDKLNAGPHTYTEWTNIDEHLHYCQNGNTYSVLGIKEGNYANTEGVVYNEGGSVIGYVKFSTPSSEHINHHVYYRYNGNTYYVPNECTFNKKLIRGVKNWAFSTGSATTRTTSTSTSGRYRTTYYYYKYAVTATATLNVTGTATAKLSTPSTSYAGGWFHDSLSTSKSVSNNQSISGSITFSSYNSSGSGTASADFTLTDSTNNKTIGTKTYSQSLTYGRTTTTTISGGES